MLCSEPWHSVGRGIVTPLYTIKDLQQDLSIFPLDIHYDFMTLRNDPSLRLCLTTFAVYKGCVVPLEMLVVSLVMSCG